MYDKTSKEVFWNFQFDTSSIIAMLSPLVKYEHEQLFSLPILVNSWTTMTPLDKLEQLSLLHVI